MRTAALSGSNPGPVSCWVTEATNGAQELFGDDRLQNALNEQPDLPVDDLLHKIKNDIDSFVGEAEQFDDITMLGLKYHGEKG